MATLQPVMAAASKMYLAQYVMGVALARQGQYPQAIERLRAAIELQPDSAWAHYEMGSSLLKTGDFKTAAIHLEIAASRLPDFAEAHSLLAQSYDHLGRSEDAKRERSRTAALKRLSLAGGGRLIPPDLTAIRTSSIIWHNAIMSIIVLD